MAPSPVTPELRAILEGLAEHTLLIEPSGRILAANRAFAKAMGMPGDRLVGTSLFEHSAGSRDRLEAYLRYCAGTRQTLPGAMILRRPGDKTGGETGGETVDYRCDAINLGAAGILLRCRPKLEAVSQFTLLNQRILDLTREIAARHRAEEELRRLNETLEERVDRRAREIEATFQRLHESERNFRILVEGASDYAIFMLDPAGVISTWNTGAERIKGYTAGEIIGRHFSVFYTEGDRLAKVPHEALATATRTGKFEAEAWRVRKDGSKFWASIVIDAIRDNAGKLIGFAKVTRDLTERRLAEEQLRRAQKMEAIGQLTGGVAHDFNNLLMVIRGNVEMLQRRLSSDFPETRRLIDGALRGVERATALTNGLLAFSRSQPLDPKPLQMNRLLAGMSELLGRTLGEHVAVVPTLADGLWVVSVDRNQLENALLNLALNARDAMPGGGTLIIETANAQLDAAYAAVHPEAVPGDYVMLAVGDTGNGIPADIIGKVFDPFFTTKKMGEGTGLGLSQVYGFIRQSGGHIRIDSEAGAGTVVRLYLPRLVGAHLPAAAGPASERPPTARGDETILVVEDNAEVRAYSTEALRELGYAIVEAADGHDALAILEAHDEIRLLFTDVGLPGNFNGRELVQEALRRRPQLKILFTSGYAQNAIVHDGRLDPGVKLIVKPFTYGDLAAKIRGVLDDTL